MSNFHLIANPIFQASENQFEIQEGYILRKPNSFELKIIRDWVHKMLTVIISHEHPYDPISKFLMGTSCKSGEKLKMKF